MKQGRQHTIKQMKKKKEILIKQEPTDSVNYTKGNRSDGKKSWCEKMK